MADVGHGISRQAQRNLHGTDISQILERGTDVDDVDVRSHSVAVVGVVWQKRVHRMTVVIELKLPWPGRGAGVKPGTGGGSLSPACLIHHLHVTLASVIDIRI